MGSAIKLKNTQNQEFSINHNDNAGAISIDSDKIMTKITSTDNAIVRFNGANGDVQSSNAFIDDYGNLQIGPVGSLINHNTNHGFSAGYGSVVSRSGGLGINILDNVSTDGEISGGGLTNTNYKLTGLATAYKAYNGNHYWFTAPSGTPGNAITWTNIMSLDTSGNLLLNSGTGALGYGIGAGGTVTQLTSKSTAVTLNKPTGKIITASDALVGGASAFFTVSNSLISSGDTVLCAWESNNYEVFATATGTSVFTIKITNITATSRSDAIPIKFNVIKGATA